MKGSLYYELIEEGSLDERLSHRARGEERNLDRAARQLRGVHL